MPGKPGTVAGTCPSLPGTASCPRDASVVPNPFPGDSWLPQGCPAEGGEPAPAHTAGLPALGSQIAKKSLQTSQKPATNMHGSKTTLGRRQRVEPPLCPAENSQNPEAKQRKTSKAKTSLNSTASEPGVAPAGGGGDIERGRGSWLCPCGGGAQQRGAAGVTVGGWQSHCGGREGAGITSGWYCIATGVKEPLPRTPP